MANGKAGDHPVTDVTIHGLPAFDPAVDALIRDINGEHGWNSVLAGLYMLDAQGRLGQLRQAGDDAGVSQLLNNLRFFLQEELRQLRANK